MATRKTGDQPLSHRRGTSGSGRTPGNAPALRRRAERYREQADALEAALTETQQQFADAFAAVDAQTTTRERISDAARRNRKSNGRNIR